MFKQMHCSSKPATPDTIDRPTLVVDEKHDDCISLSVSKNVINNRRTSIWCRQSCCCCASRPWSCTMGEQNIQWKRINRERLLLFYSSLIWHSALNLSLFFRRIRSNLATSNTQSVVLMTFVWCWRFRTLQLPRVDRPTEGRQRARE